MPLLREEPTQLEAGMEAEAEDHVRTAGTLVLLSRWTQGAR